MLQNKIYYILKTSSPINVLLTHLSAVDLIVCIAVLVSMLPETFNQYEQVAPWLCSVHGFLFTFLHPMAIWTICGLNCDRYIFINHIILPWCANDMVYFNFLIKNCKNKVSMLNLK